MLFISLRILKIRNCILYKETYEFTAGQDLLGEWSDKEFYPCKILSQDKGGYQVRKKIKQYLFNASRLTW